ncbi:MAG: hypothetical protein HFE88_02825 [Acutalibacter sp.]|nr:hypothetical protein [Acutalibacter sp.]
MAIQMDPDYLPIIVFFIIHRIIAHAGLVLLLAMSPAGNYRTGILKAEVPLKLEKPP